MFPTQERDVGESLPCVKPEFYQALPFGIGDGENVFEFVNRKRLTHVRITEPECFYTFGRIFPDGGSFNTLAFGEIKPHCGSSGTAVLTWFTIKTPALASKIRFRFGLFIEGRQGEKGTYGVCRLASMFEHRTGV
jgi:hypothetical protein